MSSSDDDATKVIFKKASRPQETVMMPDASSVAGKVIGIADVQLGAAMAAQGLDADKTVFVPAKAGGTQSAGQVLPFDPVVAWVVVIEGPGRGNFKPVYYGQNSLGRGNDLRISLDYGDQRISREAHAFVIYDDAECKFFIRDNGKSNVVRVNGELVLQPAELRDRDRIQIGDTTMLFVILCDSRFEWSTSNAAKTP